MLFGTTTPAQAADTCTLELSKYIYNGANMVMWSQGLYGLAGARRSHLDVSSSRRSMAPAITGSTVNLARSQPRVTRAASKVRP